MKTFSEFCKDANIQENWFQGIINSISPNPPKPPSPPKPKPIVLAYKNYKPGVLDKSTGRFTQRHHTPPEKIRYGWKPVEVTGYDPTGNLTAYQKPLTQTSPPSVAVPYVSSRSNAPKIPFGTQLKFTNKPMGKDTKTIGAEVTDTGDFGRPDAVNPKTYADASPTLQRLLNPRASNTNEFGKHMTYVKVKK